MKVEGHYPVHSLLKSRVSGTFGTREDVDARTKRRIEGTRKVAGSFNDRGVSLDIPELVLGLWLPGVLSEGRGLRELPQCVALNRRNLLNSIPSHESCPSVHEPYPVPNRTTLPGTRRLCVPR